MKAIIVVLLLVAAVLADLPTYYNTQEAHPECATPILNQGQCGSCWAFSTVESLSERFCIASNGKTKDLILSPQYLANCDEGSSGCGGGDHLSAYNTIMKNGNDDINCTKYVSGVTKETGPCPTTCDDKTPITKNKLYFLSKAYTLLTGDLKKTIENMKKDILAYGPISSSFVVKRDFIDFFKDPRNKKAVYQSKGGALLGGHAIKVIGWGVDNSTGHEIPYWQCVNSWGPEWGDDGKFKIIMGIDDCQIESRRVSAGIPIVPSQKIRLPVYAMYNHFDNHIQVIDGGFVKQAEVDYHLEALAFKAIENLNRANGHSQIDIHEVVEVATQVVNGVNYKYTLKVKGQGAEAVPYTSTLLVHVDSQDRMSIKGFF